MKKRQALNNFQSRLKKKNIFLTVLLFCFPLCCGAWDQIQVPCTPGKHSAAEYILRPCTVFLSRGLLRKLRLLSSPLPISTSEILN